MDINNYEIVFTEVAKEEIEGIYKYISENLYEIDAANRLMQKIENSILNLELYPYSCVEVHIKPNNEMYRRLLIDNFIALYGVDEKYNQGVIYRVIYGKTDYLNLIEE